MPSPCRLPLIPHAKLTTNAKHWQRVCTFLFRYIYLLGVLSHSAVARHKHPERID
jgi:hypothetical protein